MKQRVNCIRHRPNITQRKKADLPSSRVEESAAFSHTGVDFFGPLYIKEKKLRNIIKIKAYGCVFICITTKAVHIEIVSDLTTNGLQGAFRRLIGLRGISSNMYSDIETNFIGANNQLRELYILIQVSIKDEQTNLPCAKSFYGTLAHLSLHTSVEFGSQQWNLLKTIYNA